MNIQEQRLRELYERFQTNDLPASELNEFLQMMSHPATEKLAKELMDRTWSEVHGQAHHTPVVSITRTHRFRYIATTAAAVLLLFFISNFFISRNKGTRPLSVAQSAGKSSPAPNDLAPGRNLAMLTLANGSQIVLDSSRTGMLASQGNTRVIKLGSGQLSYAADKVGVAGAGHDEILYNTISTPRGGQYQVELPDGSQIWLNAASTLRFPTAFKGAQRSVDLTGEAYFEIARNKAVPFIVRVNGAEVKVLGTHFNINGYGDDHLIKTTLLEGSVEISKGRSKALLIPGQQAQLLQNGESLKIATADTAEAVAWKNGYFQFNKSGIESVMKQVSRWYDLDVEYEGEKPAKHFGGKIARSVYLSEMLKVIEVSGVRFRLEGKILKVMS